MRIAIYARVSTEGKGQDTENQLADLKAYCERSADTIVREYIDHETGKHGNRAQLQEMLKDASRRKFDAVLVWALDRLTREGIEKTFAYIRALKENDVEFISYSEQHFRTTGPAGDLMLSIAAWIAEQERKRISDRTIAGLQRVKKAGKVLGRRKVAIDAAKLANLRKDGHSIRECAEILGLKRGVVAEAVKGMAA